MNEGSLFTWCEGACNGTGQMKPCCGTCHKRSWMCLGPRSSSDFMSAQEAHAVAQETVARAGHDLLCPIHTCCAILCSMFSILAAGSTAGCGCDFVSVAAIRCACCMLPLHSPPAFICERQSSLHRGLDTEGSPFSGKSTGCDRKYSAGMRYTGLGIQPWQLV